MNEKIIRCPVCGKITALEKNGQTQKLEKVNGICWKEIGYSVGGWGRRQNFVDSFSGEVCDGCFTALKTKINEFKEVFDKRKDSCEEGICIYKKPQHATGGNNVHDLQDDELQSKRHKTSILRLLSPFSRIPNQ